MRPLPCILLLALLGSPLLLQACNQPNPLILVTEPLTPDGTTLRALAGQRFEVVLPALGARPSHEWVLQPLQTETVAFVETRAARSEHPRQPPPDYVPNMIFVFEALARGEIELVFVQEPLAEDGQTAFTFRYPVEVQGTAPADAVASATPSPPEGE
ncbi:MAG: hypothetical protein IGS03_08220 [Candidatus Sericytochromatia bacterium]|nr:hypothetical protein [Candidatus Sericytochromatia bacterium]